MAVIFTVAPRPVPTPSPDVLAAVGDHQAATEKFVAESERKRVAAMTLHIAALIMAEVLPVAGALWRRGAGLALLLAMSLLLFPACSAQVGSESEPLVQVGSEGQPLANMPVSANVAATVAASVDATLDSSINVASPSATLAGSADLSGIASDTSKQETAQRNTSSAGGDNRPIETNLSINGSGWPFAAAILGVALLWLFYTIHRCQVERLAAGDAKCTTVEQNAQGVARAIHDLGPGPVRDKLLTLISRRVKDRDAWEATVGSYDVSIGDRTQQPSVA